MGDSTLDEAPWRAGRKVGRTLYRQAGADPTDGDQLIGVLDTPALAAQVVAEHRHAVEFRAILAEAEQRATEPAGPDQTAALAARLGLVPLADVLDALEEEGRLAAWRLTPDAADVYSRAMTMLAERFAPAAPEGADERNGHG